MLPASADVVVVGGGNAALCAALAAAEHGVSVLVLERAPEDEAGGNSRFTAGAMRCVYDGVADLKALMPDLTEQEIAQTDFGTYTEDQFFDDMYRVTEYRTDPELVEVRGTRFNTGDAIKMALDANAMPTGNWSGGHAVAWDRNAPEFGDLSVGDNFQKHNYPFAIMINANGERFVDEGADFRNYT